MGGMRCSEEGEVDGGNSIGSERCGMDISG